MTTSDRARRTPIWKVALIPVLLIGLIWNVMRDTDVVPVLAAEELPTVSAAAESDRILSVTDVLQELQRTRQAEKARSPLQLERILEFDPFLRVGELARQSGMEDLPIPAAINSPPPGDPATSVTTTRVLTNPVKAVLDGPHGPVALVDSRIVRVGDYLEPNVRIVTIRSDGIVVELTDQAGDAK